jgi:AcrR family transcriptional regulator
MPRSSEPARRQLLDTALRLFAAQGVASVSLREIRIAAKQRNAGALHYHFGSKEGLLRALFERELPPLVARRRQLLAEAATTAQSNLRAVAAIFVLPFAEMATGTEHERSVVLLLNQIHDDVSLSFAQIMDLVGDTAIGDAAALLRGRLKGLPDDILAERLAVANSIFLHAAAARVRGGSREQRLDDRTFRENLVDMFHGILIAPVAP